MAITLGISPRAAGESELAMIHITHAVAVVIKAEPIGSEQLSYYGRTSELYSANLTVRDYRTSDRSPIGSGFRQKVQFTSLNADTQAEDAVNGRVDGLVAELASYRKRG